MSKLKLMTIVGTRPEIIRLSAVIKKCDKYFEHILVHTGQNYDYELNKIFFEDLSLKEPDYYLNVVGNNLGETVGNVIAKSFELMEKVKPDALLILGDTNSALSAISAKRLKIPVFHMEAGNRCYDENLPEETNRKIVDHISDVNLCYSKNAEKNLNFEGRPKERTFITGSPMAEVLTQNLDGIYKSDVLERLNLKKNNYILLSAHREENIDSEQNFMSLMNSVNALADKYKMPIIYSTHPRSKKFIEKRGFKFRYNVFSLKPFNFTDYNNLQINSFCVVSDSGTLPEESAFFATQGKPFPAVCIRTSTERPEAVEKGNFILAGISEKSVMQSVELAVTMNENGDLGSPVLDYVDTTVSNKVVKLIQSYIENVNKFVWHKN